MTRKVEAYACDYCNKTWQRKGQATLHERHHCKHSPIAARCDGCANLGSDFSEMESGQLNTAFQTKAICSVGIDLYTMVIDNNRSERYEQKRFRKHCPEWKAKEGNEKATS